VAYIAYAVYRSDPVNDEDVRTKQFASRKLAVAFAETLNGMVMRRAVGPGLDRDAEGRPLPLYYVLRERVESRNDLRKGA
jgi:hypothetical protein